MFSIKTDEKKIKEWFTYATLLDISVVRFGALPGAFITVVDCPGSTLTWTKFLSNSCK